MMSVIAIIVCKVFQKSITKTDYLYKINVFKRAEKVLLSTTDNYI